jgi:YggT family protein
LGSFILQIGHYIYEIYYWLILIFILGSWFPKFYSTKAGILISKIVDPYLAVFRRFIPPIGVIDLSPFIAIIAFRYLGGFALEGLRQLMIMVGI